MGFLTRGQQSEPRVLKAQLALAESDLANAKIVAPIAGVVGNRTVRTGQYVRAGAQVMAITAIAKNGSGNQTIKAPAQSRAVAISISI